jgi:hypothetical protein
MRLKFNKTDHPDSETIQKAIFVLESDTPYADALRAAIHSNYLAIMARQGKEDRQVELRTQLKKRQDELDALNNKKF